MPHVLKRYGNWQAKIYVKGRPLYRSLRIPETASKREAFRRALELEHSLRADGDLVRMTWTDAVRQYLVDHEPADRHRPQTHQSRRQRLRCFLRFVDPKALIPADTDDARDLIARYLTGRARAVAAATVACDRRYLSHLCSWLMRSRRKVRWTLNPASGRLHSLPVPERGVPEILSPFEDGLLAMAHFEQPTWPLLVLMRYAGLRTCEALALTWKAVDLRGRMIHLERTKIHVDRQVPIGDGLARLLAELPRASEYVCPSPAGMQWEEHNCLRRWKQIGEAARLPGQDPELPAGPLPAKLLTRTYYLRRTCISLALQRGLPAAIASRVFGHTVSTMMRFYANLQVAQAMSYL